MQLSQGATKPPTFNFLSGENSCPELSHIWGQIIPPITTSDIMRKTKTDSRYLFFSKRTDDEKKASDFSLECRAVNPVTADAIEISVERLDSKYVTNGNWNFSNWSTGSGRFRNRPDYIESAGEIAGEIAGEQYNGWNYTITNEGTLAGRSAIFFKKVNDYIIAISILSDGFFTEDAPNQKNHAIGRMLDWFGKANTPAVEINAESGGYYLNDIMAPSTESTIGFGRMMIIIRIEKSEATARTPTRSTILR